MIVVTLLCCYAACWGPTKRRGVEDVYALREFDGLVTSHRRSVLAVSRLPLVVEVTEGWAELPDLEIPFTLGSGPGPGFPREQQRRYYFWFFGYVANLPFEWDIKPVVNGVSGAT